MAVTHIFCCYYLAVFFIYFTLKKIFYDNLEFSVKKCFLMWNFLKKYKIAFFNNFSLNENKEKKTYLKGALICYRYKR